MLPFLIENYLLLISQPSRIQSKVGEYLLRCSVVLLQLAESDGIVFIDEIDKIVTNHETRHGADASSEGVQRDLLPIIEGR